jgi:hypothetical protein
LKQRVSVSVCIPNRICIMVETSMPLTNRWILSCLYIQVEHLFLISFSNNGRKQRIHLSVIDQFDIWELSSSNCGWRMDIISEVYCGFPQSFEGEFWACWILNYANLRSPIRNNNNNKYYFSKMDSVNRNIKVLNLNMVTEKDAANN